MTDDCDAVVSGPDGDMRIVVEHDGWMLMRDAKGNVFFADRHDRDIADCPISLLFDKEKSIVN